MTALASDTIDTPLVRQEQIGDQQAVADLLRLSRPIAEHAVARQVRDYQSVDDLAHTTLLVLLTGLPSSGLQRPTSGGFKASCATSAARSCEGGRRGAKRQ
jgi:DNA-directed RNA polymerase specialized sigma24 family protein